MFEYIIKSLAPHHCLDCGQVGSVLCGECKYNITFEANTGCIYCGLPSADGVCKRHRLPYSRARVVAQRHGVVESLINDMKYHSNRAAAKSAAELLADNLPDLPTNTVLVPVPTAPRHIRQRGFDHTLMIVRHLGRLKRLPYSQVVTRRNNLKQVGSSRQQRLDNAKQAYLVDDSQVDADKIYLVIDDVYTSGASAHYACKRLKQAGATQVWLAVVARQDMQSS